MGRYVNRPSAEGSGLWTDDEHQRFLDALELYPSGPWKLVAEFVGTRNVRQTMTHAQKYKQKKVRHERGLRCRRRCARATAPQVTLIQPAQGDSKTLVTVETSFLGLLQHESITALVPPVTVYGAVDPFNPDELDQFALETPVVSDCLDYLMRSFA